MNDSSLLCKVAKGKVQNNWNTEEIYLILNKTDNFFFFPNKGGKLIFVLCPISKETKRINKREL